MPIFSNFIVFSVVLLLLIEKKVRYLQTQFEPGK